MRRHDAVATLLALAVLGLSVELARESPGPGPLAAAHARLPELGGLAGCQRCHTPTGLADGCGGCHVAIAAQLESATGWHGARLADGVRDCDRCHGEHWGAEFPLVNALSWGGTPPDFASAHRHVAFALAGAHAALDCADCHERRAATSFLGLAQECATCHADPHGSAMSDDCASCHAQEAFVPAARFEHSRRFPLLGPHAEAGCGDCHPRGAELDFASVRGTRCADCHASPHLASLPGRCDDCHFPIDGDWSAAAPRFGTAAHAATGFPLTAPHVNLACASCHTGAELPAAFAARFPGRAAGDCSACHRSPHGGQFGAREADCAACHDSSFSASRIDPANHVPPLTGAHVASACSGCHRRTDAAVSAAAGATTAVRFVGTPSACVDCHGDPHGGQFRATDPSCSSCHDTGCFQPSRYDFAARHPPLVGAHARATCRDCHLAPSAEEPVRWVGTPTECADCHVDPHAGQFRPGPGGCADCHTEERFAPSRLTATRHQPPLDGAHLAVACNRCHLPDANEVRRFAATPQTCKSCHADPHGGQLTRHGNDCSSCHRSAERWLPVAFDHARDSRFALDGVHARLACSACHPRTRLPDGREQTHYVPLGVECRDCHAGR